MRIVCLFILSCFLFLGGYCNRLDKDQWKRMYNPVHLSLQTNLENANASKQLPLLATSTPLKSTQHIFDAEDDDDITFSRKYVLLADYFIAFTIVAWLYIRLSIRGYRLHLIGINPHIPVCKYVLQHNFRI